MKLPDHLVETLNNLGLGGRLIYVPLRKRTKVVSEEVYESMMQALKQGRYIDLDEYCNLVSLRTLYRLKNKAIEDHANWKKQQKKVDEAGTEGEALQLD